MTNKRLPQDRSLPTRAERLAALAEGFARCAASAALVCALVACGGSGSGDGSSTPPATPPAPAPPPSASAGDYLLFGISSSGLAADNVEVFDVDVPKPTALTLPLVGYGYLGVSSVFSIDSAARTTTYAGRPMAYFLKQGKAYQVSLLKSGTPTPVQISSMTTACTVVSTATLDATTGSDEWVFVTDAGSGSGCDSPVGARTYAIRTSMPVTTAPVALGDGVTVIGDQLIDATGHLVWVLALDSSGGTSKLIALNPSLAPTDVVNGAGFVEAQTNNANGLLDDANYIRTDGQLRRLTGNASALTLSPPLYTFSPGYTNINGYGLLDGASFYFVDQNKVFVTTGSGTATV